MGGAETKSAGDGLRVRVVTDGRPGNEKPALALAQALAVRWRREMRAEPTIALVRIELKAWVERLPAAAIDALGLGVSGLTEPKRADVDADLIIGAGRRSAPVLAALGRRAGDRRPITVQLMNPQMRLSRFDLVIAPRHDQMRGRNVFETVGAPTDIDPRARPPRHRAIEALPKPLIGVLLGGPSRSARFTMDDAEALARALTTLATLGAGVAATVSPRTTPGIADRMRAAAAAAGGWFWGGEADGENPYDALMAHAQALIVTADSVNMASEAASTGRPVFIAPVERLAAKLERFHTALREGGHARALERGLERGRLDDWRPKRLDDAGKAAAAVLALMRERRGI